MSIACRFWKLLSIDDINSVASYAFCVGMDNQETLEDVSMGYRMDRPVNCDEATYEKMCECWNEEAENRPSFESLYQYFEDYSVSTEPLYA